ncbi:hypothetical protein [Ammoniphilus sp. CFH 90114]|uniref:hypothetical protein n=1 Tax=Ammoniphilus sp. CFH 90114 TaxID=2493665 RepID=UPI00100DC871|nr:hypothetical protein [Ammoniphilus sp. CFH 90114]RXT06971.1 hypothetical protein EIZ39_12480 [Ammoniphilus sp. CFH 90114]
MEDIAEGLRAVLQEELKPFKKDLQAIKEGQKRLERSFEDIRTLAGRMNYHSHDDILPILERLELKIDNMKADMVYLSGKQGNQEMEIHCIHKMIHSRWD